MSTLLALQPEEKMKFDSIFDSLGPVSGILTGDKVKPVLLNSKLPVDILGRVGGPCARFFFFPSLGGNMDNHGPYSFDGRCKVSHFCLECATFGG